MFGKRCVHKETFHSLGRSYYQCPQGAYVCRDRCYPSDERTISFLMMCNQSLYTFYETRNSIQCVIGDVYCLIIKTKNVHMCVYVRTKQNSECNLYCFRLCNASCHVLINLFWEQKPTVTSVVGDGTQ